MEEDRDLRDSTAAFLANVGGRVIVARSVTDAAVLNLAGEILAEDPPKRHDTTLIESIATLLDGYDLRRAAGTLRERHSNKFARILKPYADQVGCYAAIFSVAKRFSLGSTIATGSIPTSVRQLRATACKGGKFPTALRYSSAALGGRRGRLS